ncbi:MAG TPA: AAA family ATPase [Rugosimonospora sp.]|nr:AAA family ATPase [Rugosimonospora sp.]
MTQTPSGEGTPRAAGGTRDWWLFSGSGLPVPVEERDRRWPQPPPWRDFGGGPDLPCPPDDDADMARRLGETGRPFLVDRHEADMVNTAICLRRPLLVTGRPGSGKSTLAYRIARELRLGPVLQWPITSRTTLRSGQYEYDAIGRAQAVSEHRLAPATGPDGDAAAVGDFLRLGPLGTALLPARLPRVLLIDEMDKSDFDLPNDLLNIFEDGRFTIPELLRLGGRAPEVVVHTADPGGRATVRDGTVLCHAFPIVVITSNGEREFPPAFLRRCLRLEIPDPDEERLAAMVAAHFPRDGDPAHRELIVAFLERSRRVGGLAADQLLNAVHLATSGALRPDDAGAWDGLLDAVWNRLTSTGS